MPKARKDTSLIFGIIPGVIGLFQTLICFAIIGLEAGSVYYDAGRGTIYAGFWCSIIFFISCVSMCCFVCTGRSNGCGIYLVVQNIINGIFAIVLIIFTSLFVQNPCLCYGILCNIPPWETLSNFGYYGNKCTLRTWDKLPLLKALLACAVLMLFSNIIFIILYLIAYIWLRSNPIHDPRKQLPELPIYQPPPMVSPPDPYEHQYVVRTSSDPHYYSGDIDERVPPSAPYEHQYVVRASSEPHYYSGDIDEIVPQTNLPDGSVQMRSYKF